MTFRVQTHDGTVVIVDEVDLNVVTAYLVIRGYPPVSVEATKSPGGEPPDPSAAPCTRRGKQPN
jgi:hypothetical protein